MRVGADDLRQLKQFLLDGKLAPSSACSLHHDMKVAQVLFGDQFIDAGHCYQSMLLLASPLATVM